MAPSAGAGFARLNVTVVDSPPTTLLSETFKAVRVTALCPAALSDGAEDRIPNPFGLVEGLCTCAAQAASNIPETAASLIPPRFADIRRPAVFRLIMHHISHLRGASGRGFRFENY
jgi:hypothetical protein